MSSKKHLENKLPNQYIDLTNSKNELSSGSSMVNYQGAKIGKVVHYNKAHKIITKVRRPNAQFKYYNFHDKYLLTILISIIAIGITGLFYVERINIIFILLIFLVLVVFYLSILINIIQTLDVYADHFMHDKIKIKFELIQSINKFGHYVNIRYIKDLVINEVKKEHIKDADINDKDITHKEDRLTHYINITYKGDMINYRLPTRITFIDEQDTYKFIDEYKKSKIDDGD